MRIAPGIVLSLCLLASCLCCAAYTRTDTLVTAQGDKVYIRYSLEQGDGGYTFKSLGAPRIVPSEELRKASKNKLDRVKVVVFDRVGDYNGVKFAGLSPSTFMVPSGLRHDRSFDGFYILGESEPITFSGEAREGAALNIPVYLALYEKKKQYRIVERTRSPLRLAPAQTARSRTARKAGSRGYETESVTIPVSETMESDNSDITSALSSMNMVRQMLATENSVPFSQQLQMEIYNLRSLKNSIKDRQLLDRVNEVLLECSEKEKELTEQQNSEAQAEKAQMLALEEQQKAELEEKERKAEEKEREREEKQQKRTIWMIVGAAILGVFGFIGNAVTRHFRDVRNQKGMMEMQQSLMHQAESDAKRRTREIVRSKVHQKVNQTRTKVRQKVNNAANRTAAKPSATEGRTTATSQRPGQRPGQQPEQKPGPKPIRKSI